MKKQRISAIVLASGLVLALMVGYSLQLSAQSHNGDQVQRQEPKNPAQSPPEPFSDFGLEEGAQPLGLMQTSEAVSSTFSYQGVLKEDGQPVTGDREMVFRLYANDACTRTVGSPMTYTVAVSNGLFTVDLLVHQADFDGQALWLENEVEGVSLNCQPIQAVPYALSLRPGAIISGTNYEQMFHVRYGLDEDSGEGLFGARLAQMLLFVGAGVHGYTNMPGAGVYGEGDYDGPGTTYGVWGISNSPGGRGVSASAAYTGTVNYGVYGETRSLKGYAGYFDNNGGAGTAGVAVGGVSGSGSLNDIPAFYDAAGEFVGPNGVVGMASSDAGNGHGVLGLTEGGVGCGVYGQASSATGANRGVYGLTNSDQGYGVYGSASSATGTTRGVYGLTNSDQGYGVYGHASSNSGATYGVYGRAFSGDGYGGFFRNTGIDGRGIQAENDAVTGVGVEGTSINGSGVYGDSTDGIGVYGNVLAMDNNYGFYTNDNLYSLNYHILGAVMRVVQNSGDEPLEPGDVVVFSGMGAPVVEGGPPTILVSKADAANSTAVAGVVSSRYNVETLNAAPDGSSRNGPVTPKGAVQPGEYLLIVVEGPVQVKASAVSGALQAGDLLSAAGTAGHAAKAAEVTLGEVKTALPGTVFGKALESLDSGKGLIYVYVTLQ